jgi:hypothetical protein
VELKVQIPQNVVLVKRAAATAVTPARAAATAQPTMAAAAAAAQTVQAQAAALVVQVLFLFDTMIVLRQLQPQQDRPQLLFPEATAFISGLLLEVLRSKVTHGTFCTT